MAKPNRETYDAQILVRVTRKEKAEWEAQAAARDLSLSDAIRIAAREFFIEHETAPVDPLVAEFRALGARIESRFRITK